MKSYTHFTLLERKYLEENLKNGEKIKKIAEALGRSPSTIYREIKRNWSKKAKRYHHWHAYSCYADRRKRCHRKNNLVYNEDAFDFVFEGLQQYWSPEIIAGRWNNAHDDKISYSSIYRAIKAGLFKGIKAKTHLRRRGKPYCRPKKSSARNLGVSIHDRPQCIDDRLRFGDFEGDTVYGSVGKGYLVTGIDRRSRLLVAAIAEAKTAESTAAAFERAFAKARSRIKPLSLTLDNGTEFSEYKRLEKNLNISVFFADLHSPWQRGANENINGVLRFFFPRGTNFKNVSEDHLDYVLDLINNRPRKCLNYLSPYEYISLFPL